MNAEGGEEAVRQALNRPQMTGLEVSTEVRRGVGYIRGGCVNASARCFAGGSTKDCLRILGLKRQNATTRLGGSQALVTN
jgi:hypothetical protein